MDSDHGKSEMRSYAQRGLFVGAFMGLLVGVLVAGPRFYDWAVTQSVLVMFGAALVGAVVGRLAAALALSFMFGGAAAEESDEESQTGAENPSGAVSYSDSGERITAMEGE